MPKITQIATTVYMSGETEIKRTVCVDELGNAWELHWTRWMPLPRMPECACKAQVDIVNCAYHKALAGGRP